MISPANILRLLSPKYQITWANGAPWIQARRQFHITSSFASISDNTNTASSPTTSPSDKENVKPNDPADYSSLIPRVVVFGGSGFVGTHICEQAIKLGANVTSISRSGRPSWLSKSSTWASAVQWEHGDVFEPEQSWKRHLKGATGVISTIGAFGSNEYMYKMCGTSNVILMDAAVESNVPRFAFISVHDYQFPGGWHARDFLLKGYFQGKRDAEAHLMRVFPNSGVALRPGFIYGRRHAGNMTIPLGLIGAPLGAALRMLPTKSLAGMPIIGAAFVPPVSVDTVGKAAVSSILDDSIHAGVMDVWTMNAHFPA